MTSRIVLLLALLGLSILLSSSPVSSQSGTCNEQALEVYSVISRLNTSVNTSAVLLNITTVPSQSSYSVTLPSGYAFGYLWLQVVLPLNATFNITCNDIVQLNPSGSPTFTAIPGGTFVEVSPITGQGATYSVNTVIITISNVNSLGQTCTTSDTFSIINNPAGRVLGDPMFAGLRGQQFQIHGIDGAVYNLISDPYAQVNSRFVFLNGPRLCPVLPSTGKKAVTCWSHPGSYLGELGVKTSGDDRIFIQAGSAVDGFSLVLYNSAKVKVGSELELRYSQSNLPSGLFIANNTHEVWINVGFFTLVVENIDGFLNLRSVKVDSEHWGRLTSHGLLGQTWANKRYTGRVAEIEGEVDDYVVQEDSIFGDNFVFNKFEQ